MLNIAYFLFLLSAALPLSEARALEFPEGELVTVYRAEKPAAMAEIVRWENTVEVYLWDLELKNRINVPVGKKIRWILTGGGLDHPQTAQDTLLNSGPYVIHRFTSAAIEKAETLKLVLPSLDNSPSEHVVAIHLR